MRAMRLERAVLILSFLAIAGGCGSPALIQVETTVKSNGSCDRTIWQPDKELLPPEALKPEWKARWQSVMPSTIPPAFTERVKPTGERTYLTARGSFRSPGEIPDHFRHTRDEDPHLVSQLVRSYERKDYVLVIEHRWREQITNIVTRLDYIKARDELLDLVSPVLERGLEQVYGEEYEVKGLVRELRGRGRQYFEQLTNACYDLASRHASQEEWRAGLAAVAKPFGLDLFDTAGHLAPDSEQERRQEAFVGLLLSKHLRHQDGSRLTEAEVRRLTRTATGPPFEERWAAYGKSLPGEFQAKVSGCLLRMTGLYGSVLPFPFGSSPEFSFSVRLPGTLTETNGTIEAPDRTRWQFRGDRLFPDGFEMRASSLELGVEAQKRLLGRAVLTNKAGAEAFIELVDGSNDLLDAVRSACKAGDNRILRAFEPKTPNDRHRAPRLKKLLGLEP